MGRRNEFHIEREQQLAEEIAKEMVQGVHEEIWDCAKYNERSEMPANGVSESLFSTTQIGDPSGAVGARERSITQKHDDPGGGAVITNMDTDKQIPTDWYKFAMDGLAIDIECPEGRMTWEVWRRLSYEFEINNTRIFKGLARHAPSGSGMSGLLLQPSHSTPTDPTLVTPNEGAEGMFTNGEPNRTAVVKFGDGKRIILNGQDEVLRLSKYKLKIWIDGVSADGGLYRQLADFDTANNDGDLRHELPDGTLTGVNKDTEARAVIIRPRLIGTAYLLNE